MQVTLALGAADDIDAHEVAELTAQLRSRLLELDVDQVEAVRSGDIPDGARSADAITIGAMVVTLVPAMLHAVVALVESWSARHPVSGVKVTVDGDSIELTGATEEQQQRLVEQFVSQHGSEG